MPQKKNSDSLELIRGKSGRVFGDVSSKFNLLKIINNFFFKKIITIVIKLLLF